MFLSKARSRLSSKTKSVNANTVVTPKLGPHYVSPTRTSIPVDSHLPGLRPDPSHSFISRLTHRRRRSGLPTATPVHNPAAPHSTNARWWSPVSFIKRLWRKERGDCDERDGNWELLFNDESGVLIDSAHVEGAHANGIGHDLNDFDSHFHPLRPFPLSYGSRYQTTLHPFITMGASRSNMELIEEEEISTDAFNHYFRFPPPPSSGTSISGASDQLADDLHANISSGPLHSSDVYLHKNEAWWAPNILLASASNEEDTAAHTTPPTDSTNIRPPFLFSSPSLSSLSSTGVSDYEADVDSVSDYGQVTCIYSRDVDPCLGHDPLTAGSDADYRSCPVGERIWTQESLMSSWSLSDDDEVQPDHSADGEYGASEVGNAEDGLTDLGSEDIATTPFLDLFPLPIQASIGPNTQYSLSVVEPGALVDMELTT